MPSNEKNIPQGQETVGGNVPAIPDVITGSGEIAIPNGNINTTYLSQIPTGQESLTLAQNFNSGDYFFVNPEDNPTPTEKIIYTSSRTPLEA